MLSRFRRRLFFSSEVPEDYVTALFKSDSAKIFEVTFRAGTQARCRFCGNVGGRLIYFLGHCVFRFGLDCVPCVFLPRVDFRQFQISSPGDVDLLFLNYTC